MKQFVHATRDRVGCQIVNELYAMYHCYRHDIDFVGAVSQNHNRFREHNHMINMLNLPYQLYHHDKNIYHEHPGIQLLQHNTHAPFHGPKEKQHLRWFAKDDQFVSHLKRSFDEVRSNQKQQYNTSDKHHVVCHIRRGDVQHDRNQYRYFNNQYYVDILTKVINKYSEATITIHTYGRWIEPKQPFIEMGCKFVHINGGNNYQHTSRAWIDMIFCDTLITSKSGFSYVPALFNNNTVIHTSTGEWHSCNNWLSPDEL